MARSTHDDFVIDGRLGNGSYGCVWRVTRKIDGLPYAMKEIDLLGLSRKEQEDCIKETRVLSSLTSDHCIKYYDSFLERMLLGLNHMHRKKILHRDVKTLNIFLTSTDPTRMHIKLGDMGVAKILSTQTNFAKTIVGTPYYLSPELCEDKPYNEKSDVWALGVVLYECCTKRHPFDADNQGALILKILRGKYPAIPAGYTTELMDVVRMCLTLNAAKRPDTNQLLSLSAVRQHALDQGIALPEILRPSGTRPGTSASRPATSAAVASTSSRATASPLRQGVAPKPSRTPAGPSPGAVTAVTAAAVAVTAAASAVSAVPQPGSRPRSRASPPPARKAPSPRDAGGNIVVTGAMDAPPEFNPISPEDIAFKFGSTMPSAQAAEARARQMAAANNAVPAHHRHKSSGGSASNPTEVMSDGVHVGGHSAANMARAWEDMPAAELEALQLEEEAASGNRRSKDEFLADDEFDDGVQEDDSIPAHIDVDAIKKSLVMLRTAAIGMIGPDTFERLYEMIRSHSDQDNTSSSETTITELSAMVFNIIHVNQADVIPLVYKIMFLEAQIERAIVQAS